jgi:hypothetical protein
MFSLSSSFDNDEENISSLSPNKKNLFHVFNSVITVANLNELSDMSSSPEKTQYPLRSLSPAKATEQPNSTTKSAAKSPMPSKSKSKMTKKTPTSTSNKKKSKSTSTSPKKASNTKKRPAPKSSTPKATKKTKTNTPSSKTRSPKLNKKAKTSTSTENDDKDPDFVDGDDILSDDEDDIDEISDSTGKQSASGYKSSRILFNEKERSFVQTSVHAGEKVTSPVWTSELCQKVELTAYGGYN